MKKHLLVFAPLAGYWWLERYILPTLQLMTDNGWQATVYLSAIDNAWAMYSNGWKTRYPDSKIKVILAKENPPVDLSQRDYSHEDRQTLKAFMAEELAGIKPDVIMVRGANAHYLNDLYPQVRILNLMEGNIPMLSTALMDIVLQPGEEIWGTPYYNEHLPAIEKQLQLTPADHTAINTIRDEAATKLENPLIKHYVNRLRERYSKIIVFTFEYFYPLFEYITKYHTRCGSQTENLRLLLKSIPSDWAVVATFHPIDLNVDDPNALTYPRGSQAFLQQIQAELAEYKNLHWAQLDLGRTKITHSILLYADALANQNGKSMYLTMLLNKPIIQLGNFDLAFYEPLSDMSSLAADLESFTPPPQEEMNRFFFWLITRLKHPPLEKGGQMLYYQQILERAADPTLPIEQLYEWQSPELQQLSLQAIVKLNQ